MSTILGLISAGTLVSVIVMLFILGAAPQFAVRLITLLYPKGDDRRTELLAEFAHVKGLGKTLQTWHWLGDIFGVAFCEGIPARLARRAKTVLVDSAKDAAAAGILGPSIALVQVDGEMFAEVTYTFEGEKYVRQVPYSPGDTISFKLPTQHTVSMRTTKITVLPMDGRTA